MNSPFSDFRCFLLESLVLPDEDMEISDFEAESSAFRGIGLRLRDLLILSAVTVRSGKNDSIWFHPLIN